MSSQAQPVISWAHAWPRVVFLLILPALAQGGTASLTGKVRDITGAGIAGASVELHSVQATILTNADEGGVYRFSGLPAGDYTLKFVPPGWARLTVRGIEIAAGEQKHFQTLELAVANFADCGGHAALDCLRPLTPIDHTGSIHGGVGLLKGPMVADARPIANASITLVCSNGRNCGATKTDPHGEFEFGNLSPGKFVIAFSHPGFYPLEVPEFSVREGLESAYSPVYLDHCRLGNCAPWLRPRKPPGHCE